MFAAVVLIVIGVAFALAFWYDVHQRRRGILVRSGGAIDVESMHHRVDINAVPLMPDASPRAYQTMTPADWQIP